MRIAFRVCVGVLISSGCAFIVGVVMFVFAFDAADAHPGGDADLTDVVVIGVSTVVGVIALIAVAVMATSRWRRGG